MSDVGRTVDALVDDILSVEDDYSILKTNNNSLRNMMNVAVYDSNDNMQHDTDMLQIEFLKDINQLHSLDDELFYNDIDFDSFQPMCPADYDYTASGDNGEIFLDFADSGKSMEQDIMNELYRVKTEYLPDDLFNITEPIPTAPTTFEQAQRDTVMPTEPTVSVNECSTIFESDVDLEESSNLAANLNQLIGENNVQYISTEDDDTFIINLNSAIDAEQLTDMLNIGVELIDDKEKTDIEKDNGILHENKQEETKIEQQPEEITKEVKKAKEKKELHFVCKTCKKVFKKKDNYTSHLGKHYYDIYFIILDSS